MKPGQVRVLLVATFDIPTVQVGQLTELLNALPAQISMGAPAIVVWPTVIPALLQPKVEVKQEAVRPAVVEKPKEPTFQPTRGRARELADDPIVPTRSKKS